MKRHKRRSSRRNRPHSRRRHTRRNRGARKYSSFVKKHKGLFKRMGFKAASRKIASMWRKSR